MHAHGYLTRGILVSRAPIDMSSFGNASWQLASVTAPPERHRT